MGSHQPVNLVAVLEAKTFPEKNSLDKEKTRLSKTLLL